MPSGELFFRKIYLDNGQPATGNWADAFDMYGISFSDGSLSKLMTPAPNKAAMENISRLQHGKRVIRSPKYAKKDARDVTLEMHMTAPDKTTFLTRYNAFCSDILDAGFFEIRHSAIPDKIFRMTYVSCEQFSDFYHELAKFALTLNEPDPTDRGTESYWGTEGT